MPTFMVAEKIKVKIMKMIHEIPVRNRESEIQGSHVVSAGSSHPRRAGMKSIRCRSIARPVGVMDAMKK